MVVENFAELSVEEQRAIATELIDKINKESIFSEDTNFEVVEVEANDLTGGLFIGVTHSDPIHVDREATWTCEDEDDAYSDPGSDAEYYTSVIEEAKHSFKTLSTSINGYAVSLDITDVDDTDTIEVEVDTISHEDDGIGSYEHFGFTGYDSNPYIEVSGTITRACWCVLGFSVEPDDNIEVTSKEV
jgi:hypothetical protein